MPCDGTYFITADMRSVGVDDDDVTACRRLTMEAGVTAVPVSAFYQDDAPRNFVRFCFSKRDRGARCGTRAAGALGRAEVARQTLPWTAMIAKCHHVMHMTLWRIIPCPTPRTR
jgi:hypothetical protein